MSHDKWPEEDLIAVGNCAYCGSSARTVMHRAVSDVVFRTAPGAFVMMRCDDCGSGYLDPRPTDESIGRAYARYYTHDADAPEPARGGLKAALSNGYRNWRYGANLTPALDVGRQLFMAWPARRRRLDAHYRFLPRSPGEVLDFGCGNGRFLRIARELGWRCVGVDFDPAALEAARADGVDVRLGGLEAIADDQDRFDAATAAHVFEHMPAPSGLAEALFRALKPGGTLFLETPNVEAACHRLFGPAWRGVEAPRHLNLPSWKGMRRILAAAGFADVRRHPRREVFPALWRQSAALAAGEDSEGPERFRRNPPPAWRRIALTMPPSRTEFLTVTARKPGRVAGAP